MKFNCSYSELVDPKSVIPLSENPNTHPKEQIKSLAEIIKYQGQRLPIIIDVEKGDCVAGNGRLEAIRDVLKWDKIAVDYQKFENEDQRKAFIISENAISEWAHLDLGMINTQLADFDPSFDIDLLGIKDFVLEPMEKEENEVELSFEYKLEIDCKNEIDQQQILAEMMDRGFKVRVLL